MYLRRVVLLALVTTLLLPGLGGPAANSSGEAPAAVVGPGPGELTKSLTVVFVHGFGGKDREQPFVTKLAGFAAQSDYPFTVTCYAWDSVKVRFETAGHNWTVARRNAIAEAARFKETVVDKYERERTPYTLVGHSLGARVIAEALGRCGGRLRFLRGVYFLGAAVPSDRKLPGHALPAGMKIINYHSPTYDFVLKKAYYFMEGQRAGGEVGFTDRESCENYRVGCTRTRKGVGVHCDYSQLAVPIGHLCLRAQGAGIRGQARFNVRSPVTAGDTWWNDIAAYRDVPLRGGRGTIILQQHKAKPDHFRAVSSTAGGSKRCREAWGDNPNAVLEALGL